MQQRVILGVRVGCNKHPIQDCSVEKALNIGRDLPR